MSNQQAGNDLTRERLLDEAEQLFAEKGFHGVSVRQITAAAGSNLSAVNYYFGGKEKLYLEVFRQRWLARAKVMRDRLAELEKEGVTSAGQVIEAVARFFLMGPVSGEQRWRHQCLMMREVAQPGRAMEMVIKESVVPNIQALVRMLQPFLPHLDPEQLRLNALSLVSQLVQFNFARPVVKGALGREYDQDLLETLVKHIVEYNLRGMGLAASEQGDASRA